MAPPNGFETRQMKSRSIKITEPLLIAFEAQFKKLSPDKCWPWLGAKTSSGYGHIKKNRRTMRVHRVSYAAYAGKLTPGLTIDHLCKNKICINPKHLEEVTFRENSARSDNPSAINKRKTKCPAGHPYDYIKCNGVRGCIRCYRKTWRMGATKRRDKLNPHRLRRNVRNRE